MYFNRFEGLIVTGSSRKGSLAPVVQTLVSPIHQINLYPADIIRWIVIYPADSAIQRLNNRGLVLSKC